MCIWGGSLPSSPCCDRTAQHPERARPVPAVLQEGLGTSHAVSAPAAPTLSHLPRAPFFPLPCSGHKPLRAQHLCFPDQVLISSPGMLLWQLIITEPYTVTFPTMLLSAPGPQELPRKVGVAGRHPSPLPAEMMATGQGEAGKREHSVGQTQTSPKGT